MARRARSLNVSSLKQIFRQHDRKWSMRSGSQAAGVVPQMCFCCRGGRKRASCAFRSVKSCQAWDGGSWHMRQTKIKNPAKG